jgi:hypothetical protein
MTTQYNDDASFDGLDASFEFTRNGADSSTAKANLRVGPPALFAMVLGAAVILSNGDALERLLDAVPALAERVGDRLVAAT